jgi:hypothetical protein
VLELVDALHAARVELGEAEFQKRCPRRVRQPRPSRS